MFLLQALAIAPLALPAMAVAGTATQLDGDAMQKHLRQQLLTSTASGRFAALFSLPGDSLNIYSASIIPVGLVTLFLAWKTRPKVDESLSPKFKAFMRTYLPVWYLAVGADWLQGPYVYALYSAYGYSSPEIAQLFVAGFGSSMICGTFVGSLADTWGRKRSCLLYCVMYIISCITKHYHNYHVLMLGRVTGGIATSILFSGFESWMVSEHMQRHSFSGNLLSYIFSLMFFGMYAVAITAGVVAQFCVDAVPMKETGIMKDLYYGGYIMPFDLSMICLVVCMFPIAFGWNENYGSQGGNGSILKSLQEAIGAVTGNIYITLMGVVVCAFEGSMFCFVFNWTPALASEELPLPHGLVFAMFMMACMCGSSAFALVSESAKAAVIMVPVLVLATISLGMVAVVMAVSTSPLHIIFACFMLFEFCVGCYWPIVGTLKSDVVPEKVRATVYNLYRVPLNFVVCGLLLGNLSLLKSFSLCAVLLVTSVLSMLPITKAKST